MKTKSRVSVAVRQWEPRKAPYSITPEKLDEWIAQIKPNVGSYLYAGWAKRVKTGKRTLGFYLATGATRSDARKNFKKSTDFGETIWEFS